MSSFSQENPEILVFSVANPSFKCLLLFFFFNETVCGPNKTHMQARPDQGLPAAATASIILLLHIQNCGTV